jgi:hypothetical protein
MTKQTKLQKQDEAMAKAPLWLRAMYWFFRGLSEIKPSKQGNSITERHWRNRPGGMADRLRR